MDRCPSNLPVDGHVVRRVEVLAGPERRRWWSWEETARIVAESLAPGAVAGAIALRYGLHRNQLYAWRKELRDAAEDAARERPSPPGFVPVVVTDEAAGAGVRAIEIEVAGALVRVPPGVDPGLLAAVLRTLKRLG